MFSTRIQRLSDSLIREVIEASRRPGVISFAGGLPAMEAMAELDWSGAPPSLAQYGPAEGEPELRKSIAAYLDAAGLPCRDTQVLVLSGSQQGIELAARLFVDEGTCVLVESPTYSPALQNFGLFGARYAIARVGSQGIDPAEFEAAVVTHKPAFAYLITNFQNPTGTCYGLEVRREIAAICDKYQLPVVEDDAYRELSYDDADRTPLTAFLKNAPWIYLGTFSKTVMPGIRLGYLACSEPLFPLLLQLKHSTDLLSNRYAQWVLQRFVGSPSFETHIQRIRTLYAARRDHMNRVLQTHFSDVADWAIPKGGLFFWLKLKHDADLMSVLKQSLDAGVAFMPGIPFFPDQAESECCIRLNFSHANPDQVEQGLSKLAGMFSKD